MNLKQFKKLYFSDLKNYQFSELLGFNNSFISKIMNGKYKDINKSQKLLDLKKCIYEKYNVEIDFDNLENPYFKKIQNLENEIRLLKEKMKECENEKKELENIITNILSYVRLISECKNAFKNGKFNIKKYYYKKGVK